MSESAGFQTSTASYVQTMPGGVGVNPDNVLGYATGQQKRVRFQFRSDADISTLAQWWMDSDDVRILLRWMSKRGANSADD